MSDTTLLSKGIHLMAQSPFKATLAPVHASSLGDFNAREALVNAKSSNVFSNVGQYLGAKDHVKSSYRDAVSSRSIQSPGNISDAFYSELADDPASSHLKIKLLSEYALANRLQGEKLMNIDELRALSTVIEMERDTRGEIKVQLKNNSKLIDNALCNGVSNEDDNHVDILRTLNSSNEMLLNKLADVNEKLEGNLAKLNNQYILALSLCYFEDLDVNSPPPIDSYDKETEELMSYIASIAVQRNITLPTPERSASKSKWAKDCLDAILENTTTELQRAKSQRRRSPSESIDKDDDARKLKTALQDLQFAHSYLTRQYEDERNLNHTVLESHKKKKHAIEKKLSENVIELERANQRAILVEHEKQMLEEKLEEKLAEIHDLRKQVTNLKIDNLGFVHGTSLSSSSISPDKENHVQELSPTSPLTGVSLGSNPKTPLLRQNTSNNIKRHTGSQSPKLNSSISVLRKEFKKLVNDMHNDFESELQKEKTERKRLQNLVRLFEERYSEIDL